LCLYVCTQFWFGVFILPGVVHSVEQYSLSVVQMLPDSLLRVLAIL